MMNRMAWLGITAFFLILSCSNGDDVAPQPKESRSIEQEPVTVTITATGAEDLKGEGNPDEEAPPDNALFDAAVFADERAAWEEQNLRSYRYVTTFVSSGAYWGPSAEITISAGKEPDVVIHSEEPWEHGHGNTIDEFYQEIADGKLKYPADFTVKIRYNKQYHYPEFYTAYPDGRYYDGGRIKIEITEFEPLDD
jgi:hypothetical protein